MKIIEIQIVKTKSENVKARIDIHFEGFWLKGFKILQDPETKKEYVTPPSYKSFEGWRPLFKTDDSEDWKLLQQRILEKYQLYRFDIPNRSDKEEDKQGKEQKNAMYERLSDTELNQISDDIDEWRKIPNYPESLKKSMPDSLKKKYGLT
jgi:hypothetical protein